MQEWLSLWLLNLNLEKYKAMHIGKTLGTNYKIITSTSSGPVILNEVNFEKDLVVWTLSSLVFSLHCNKTAACATKVLGMLKRTFTRITKELFVFLYKTYVRPHLENCVQLWCPYLAKDIDTLERVQRQETKLVSVLADLPYEERLKELGIYSLYCRKQHGDLIETFKILWLL